MFVLSFDIGVKNLAYCYADDGMITKWGTLDIFADNIYAISSKCMLLLQHNFSDLEIDVVLLENQPVQKNPKMKSIQMVVYSYFLYQQQIVNRNIRNIIFQSASNKNKFMNNFDVVVRPYKSKYTMNKKKAISCTRSILENEENTEWLDFFNSHKKQDDLADSYLQLLHYIDYTPVLPNPPSPREDV
jgi:flagellar biosynthesis chaperone FliJ